MVTSAPSCVTGCCTLEIESDERRRRRSEAAAATMAEARSASVMKACIHSEGSVRGEGEGLGCKPLLQRACICEVLALTATRSPSRGYLSRKFVLPPLPPPPLPPSLVTAHVGLKVSSVRASVSTVQSCGSLRSVSSVIVTLSSWYRVTLT